MARGKHSHEYDPGFDEYADPGYSSSKPRVVRTGPKPLPEKPTYPRPATGLKIGEVVADSETEQAPAQTENSD